MNVTIAEIFKTSISGLNFVDKLGGLVTVKEVKQADGTIKKVPVDYSLSQHQSNKYNHPTYTPDGSKKSVIYFEDGGIALESHQSRYINLVSSIKLVAWFNLKRINKNLNTASTLLLLLMQNIPKSIPNQANILKGIVEFQGQDVKSPEIFSAYDYNESEIQHLMYPYDYGALNYNIKFSVRPECLTDITLLPDDCITNPNC